jgi:hypothetical protein
MAWGRYSQLPQVFLRAAATTTQDGAYASSVIYTPATITLTPGTWIVFAGVSVINLTTSDDASVGIYNRTTSAAVANSRGAAAIGTTTARVAVTSQQTLVTVTVSTQLCPEAYPNGGSTLSLRSAAGGSAGYISATRISNP